MSAKSRSMSQLKSISGVQEGFLGLPNEQLTSEEGCWQFGSTSSLAACSSQYPLVQRVSGLEHVDIAKTGKDGHSQGGAEIELEWHWVVDEAEESTCEPVRTCLNLGDARLNNSLDSLCPEFGGETGLGESSSPQVFFSEFLAANRATKGFNRRPVNEIGHSCFPMSQADQGCSRQPPATSQNTSLTACLGEHIPRHVSSKLSSECTGGRMLLPQKCSSSPQPLVVLPHPRVEHSLEDESKSWSTETTDLSTPEKLGVALCHSQTRARNAEKLASEALKEKEELATLVCREASTNRMYKTRVHLLELENLWLKTRVEVVPPFLKAAASRHCKFYQKGFAKDSASMPGMIGLAFALGLSCASAGFVIGCCLDLIGLPP